MPKQDGDLNTLRELEKAQIGGGKSHFEALDIPFITATSVDRLPCQAQNCLGRLVQFCPHPLQHLGAQPDKRFNMFIRHAAIAYAPVCDVVQHGDPTSAIRPFARQ